MAKTLLLVLAIGTGFVAQQCGVNTNLTDMKVWNRTSREIRVFVNTPDTNVLASVGAFGTARFNGLALGKWTVTVIVFRRTEYDQLAHELKKQLSALRRRRPDQNLTAELAQLQEQLRAVGQKIRIESFQRTVASCSGKYDDDHLQGFVTVAFEGGAWKASC